MLVGNSRVIESGMGTYHRGKWLGDMSVQHCCKDRSVIRKNIVR